MIRYRLVAVTALAAMMSLGTAYAGGWPHPETSTVPAFLRLVDSAGGIPDSLSGKFVVVCHDLIGNPTFGCNVVVDLSGCPDLRLASNQENPNVTVNCALHWVSAYTDRTGTVPFTVLGNSGPAVSYSGAHCARIYGDGVLLGTPTVAAFDLDGTGGVSAGDISVWLGDLDSGTYRARSDFNGDGRLSAADMSVWLGVRARNGSTTTGATCP